MSKPLGRKQLEAKADGNDKRNTHGENRNTPESVSAWLDCVLPELLRDNLALITGASTDRPEVGKYQEHVRELRAAVKAGNWRTAIAAAWQAGQSQAASGLAEDAWTQRQVVARLDEHNDGKQTTLDEMRRQLRAWDKQLEGSKKKRAAMQRLRIPKTTYYAYRKAVNAAGKKPSPEP